MNRYVDIKSLYAPVWPMLKLNMTSCRPQPLQELEQAVTLGEMYRGEELNEQVG